MTRLAKAESRPGWPLPTGSRAGKIFSEGRRRYSQAEHAQSTTTHVINGSARTLISFLSQEDMERFIEALETNKIENRCGRRHRGARRSLPPRPLSLHYSVGPEGKRQEVLQVVAGQQSNVSSLSLTGSTPTCPPQGDLFAHAWRCRRCSTVRPAFGRRPSFRSCSMGDSDETSS